MKDSKIKPESTQSSEKLAILKSLESSINFIGTFQDNFHSKVLIPSTLYTFRYKNCDLIDTILNSLMTVKGTVRYEAVAYWYKHIAGFNTKYSTQLKGYITVLAHKNKQLPLYASEVLLHSEPIKFTYDVKHLDICKRVEFRYWKIAPVIHKELKVPTDVTKVTAGVEIQLARALAMHAMTESEITNHLSTMVARIIQQSNSVKTKEWVTLYNAQKAPSDVVEYTDLTDVEEALAIVELENATTE
jgi:hypothetical protein